MIESCFDNHLNVQHATDYMGTYLMYLWAINVIVIIDSPPPKKKTSLPRSPLCDLASLGICMALALKFCQERARFLDGVDRTCESSPGHTGALERRSSAWALPSHFVAGFPIDSQPRSTQRSLTTRTEGGRTPMKHPDWMSDPPVSQSNMAMLPAYSGPHPVKPSPNRGK